MTTPPTATGSSMDTTQWTQAATIISNVVAANPSASASVQLALCIEQIIAQIIPYYLFTLPAADIAQIQSLI